jgi:hypothetical protein
MVTPYYWQRAMHPTYLTLPSDFMWAHHYISETGSILFLFPFLGKFSNMLFIKHIVTLHPGKVVYTLDYTFSEFLGKCFTKI